MTSYDFLAPDCDQLQVEFNRIGNERLVVKNLTLHVISDIGCG